MSATSIGRIRHKIGAEARALRQALGWTQTKAARKIKLPQGTLSVIEQGKQSPRMDTIERIAKAYGVLAVFGDGGPVFRARAE